MKKIVLSIVTCICFCFFLCGCGVSVAQINTKSDSQAIKFFNQEYVLASSTKLTMSEGWESLYILPGKTLSHSSKMISICNFPHLSDPKEAAEQFDKMLKETANVKTESIILYNEDKNEAIIDYMSVVDKDKYVEFGIFKYAQDGNNGLKNIQFVYKFYPERDDFNVFKKSIMKNRDKWVQEIADTKIPEPYKKEVSPKE